MNIEKIVMNPNKEEGFGRLRVCGYARVSTETDEQKTSFESQVEHYKKLIEANSDCVRGVRYRENCVNEILRIDECL